jgi:hypothetical protein
LGIDEETAVQRRDNSRRRDKRRRQSDNRRAREHAALQSQPPFSCSEPASEFLSTPPPPALLSKAASFLRPLFYKTPQPPPLSSPGSKPIPALQSLRNSKRREGRKRKAEEELLPPGPSKRTLANVLSEGTAIEVDINAANFDAALGAHTAKPGTKKQRGSKADMRRTYSLTELLQQGFQHIKWDGAFVNLLSFVCNFSN